MERAKRAIARLRELDTRVQGDELSDEAVDGMIEDVLLECFGRCACRADEAEPIFTLRARDTIAPMAVERWADMVGMAGSGTSAERSRAGMLDAERMRVWQQTNFHKVPD